MFLHFLEKEEEKVCFLQLCFVVALADSDGKVGMKSIELLGDIGAYEDYSSSDFFIKHSVNEAEASLLLDIIESMSQGQSTSKYYLYAKLNEVFLKAKELFTPTSSLATNQEVGTRGVFSYNSRSLFSSLILEITQNQNFSTRNKKVILFEMCNMAFRDGECSDIEEFIIEKTGKSFRLDEDIIEEIIKETEKLNTAYNTCVEIITE